MNSETKTPKITADMTIGEIVKRYPSIAEILTSYGIHCVGCGASYWETLEQGLGGHGLSPERINEIMVEINEAIPEEAGNPDEITITTLAVSKLKTIMQEKKKSAMGLRILVRDGGCSGKSYGFEFSPDATADDKVIAIDGVRFFIDNDSFEQIKGSKLDYVDSLQGAGFTIVNPLAKKSCGCGKSFAS